MVQVGATAVPAHARARRGGDSALAQARGVLTLAAVPRSLPCREAERAAVTEFVTEALSEGGWATAAVVLCAQAAASCCYASSWSAPAGCRVPNFACLSGAHCAPVRSSPADGGKCLYISGIPGTGKTATVLEVMRGLKRRRWGGQAGRRAWAAAPDAFCASTRPCCSGKPPALPVPLAPAPQPPASLLLPPHPPAPAARRERCRRSNSWRSTACACPRPSTPTPRSTRWGQGRRLLACCLPPWAHCRR